MMWWKQTKTTCTWPPLQHSYHSACSQRTDEHLQTHHAQERRTTLSTPTSRKQTKPKRQKRKQLLIFVQGSFILTKKIISAANLVLQSIRGGFVVLCKVRETVLCLVCAINDCAHGICRSSSLGTPEVVHSPLRSHLRKQKGTCLHIGKLKGWVCMKLSEH